MLCTGLLLACAAPGAAQDARFMPRAAQSLLLDAVVAGQRLVVVGDRGHILYSDDRAKAGRRRRSRRGRCSLR